MTLRYCLRHPGAVDHLPEFVAQGPVKGTDWCVLDHPPPTLVAPGGVVLCIEGTTTPHEDAIQAAQSAWEMLSRWMKLRGGRRAAG